MSEVKRGSGWNFLTWTFGCLISSSRVFWKCRAILMSTLIFCSRLICIALIRNAGCALDCTKLALVRWPTLSRLTWMCLSLFYFIFFVCKIFSFSPLCLFSLSSSSSSSRQRTLNSLKAWPLFIHRSSSSRKKKKDLGRRQLSVRLVMASYPYCRQSSAIGTHSSSSSVSASRLLGGVG